MPGKRQAGAADSRRDPRAESVQFGARGRNGHRCRFGPVACVKDLVSRCESDDRTLKVLIRRVRRADRPYLRQGVSDRSEPGLGPLKRTAPT